MEQEISGILEKLRTAYTFLLMGKTDVKGIIGAAIADTEALKEEYIKNLNNKQQ